MFAAIQAFFARPGVQSSEFKVLTAAATWLGLNAGEHWVSTIIACVIAAPGGIYAVARGLAKTETTAPPAA